MKCTLMIITVLLAHWNVCHGMLAVKLTPVLKGSKAKAIGQKRRLCKSINVGFGIYWEKRDGEPFYRRKTPIKDTLVLKQRSYRSRFFHKMEVNYITPSLENDVHHLDETFEWHQKNKRFLIALPIGILGERQTLQSSSLIDKDLLYINEINTVKTLGNSSLMYYILQQGTQDLLRKNFLQAAFMKISRKKNPRPDQTVTTDEITIGLSDENEYNELLKFGKNISILQVKEPDCSIEV